jgi:hypothetical protein
MTSSDEADAPELDELTMARAQGEKSHSGSGKAAAKKH